MSQCPVILVHGWNSHPGIWKKLMVHLDAAKIAYYRFDHSLLKNCSIPEISRNLHAYIEGICHENDYSGPFDIVCHSLGTSIVRYLLEVVDGPGQELSVRQVIGIGPLNTGSALAELFNDPKHRDTIISALTGVFVQDDFDPASDKIIQDVRPGSKVMRDLRSAGLRQDISYRVIVTSNPEALPDFFPLFQGKTWELSDDGRYQVTLDGDGIVSNRESQLPGVSLDIIPASPGADENLLSLDQYCHICMPKNPLVIERIMQYLTDQ
ncbi:MAG: acetyltransferase [Methanospirillum sp.]|uniref:esterase/lipase family protein n=1 Tax=Methanospirillum sp. TaxID=45200 RepID=UPI00237589D7|nr:acetyltransferase [Methanospirillum sp.]MDD1727771.1 acetyltransferase [Methanospirillum sp.]